MGSFAWTEATDAAGTGAEPSARACGGRRCDCRRVAASATLVAANSRAITEMETVRLTRSLLRHKCGFMRAPSPESFGDSACSDESPRPLRCGSGSGIRQEHSSHMVAEISPNSAEPRHAIAW